MEKITKQELETFRELYSKFDSLTDEIVKYIIERKFTRYLTGFTHIHEYGYLSCDTNTFDIRIEEYNGEYDFSEYFFLEIPYEHISNNTWKEYLYEQVREDVEREHERKRKEIENKEKQEYEQYLKLKEKFENK